MRTRNTHKAYSSCFWVLVLGILGLPDKFEGSGSAVVTSFQANYHMDRVKRIWYLSPMRAAKVQASLRIRAVSPEPSLLAHISSESRGTF